MVEKIKVTIAGINGRFGRASARAILADPDLELVGAFGRAGAAYVGQELGNVAHTLNTGILVSNGFLDVLAGAAPDVVLDFTTAEAAFETAKLALERGVRPVIGTSGLGEKEVSVLKELAVKHKTGGMIVPNFSVGAVLMMEFAKQAGAFFANVEIIEMHHTKKVDAPSGTALHTTSKLAQVGSGYNAREVEEKELLPGARGGQVPSGVRVHSLRLPGLISHQEVIFGAEGELLTIRHDSFNTDCFVRGILMSLKAAARLNHLLVGLENLLMKNGVKPS